MLKSGEKVRFTKNEKIAVETFVNEPVNPDTAEEAKAWLEKAADSADPTVPEERLMQAVFNQMKEEI